MVPRPRGELHDILVDILGSSNVYFQPPASVKLQYPCILYARDSLWIDHADNTPYRHQRRYLITVVDADPDSEIPDKVAQLPTAQYGRSYSADYLNHDTFRIYF